MNIPILPSENLYRFLFFSGLLLAIYTLTYMRNSRDNIVLKVIEINGELENHKRAIEYLISKKDIQIKDLERILELQSRKLDQEMITQMQKEYDTKSAEVDELEFEIDQIGIDIKTKISLLEVEKENAKELNVIMWIFYLLGIILVILGFKKWKKQQTYSDTILYNEFLKSKTNKGEKE